MLDFPQARRLVYKTPMSDEDKSLLLGEVVLGTSKEQILVTLKPDGTLEYGSGYTPDAAAQVFWEAMARGRLKMEERLLLMQHMEAVLVRLGAADLHNEAMQRQMGAFPSQEAAQAVGKAHSSLEKMVHQAIELGRGLARRPEVAIPPVPVKLPSQIADDENNSYDPSDIEDPPLPPGKKVDPSSLN